jgi:hypothetical protein
MSLFLLETLEFSSALNAGNPSSPNASDIARNASCISFVASSGLLMDLRIEE